MKTVLHYTNSFMPNLAQNRKTEQLFDYYQVIEFAEFAHLQEMKLIAKEAKANRKKSERGTYYAITGTFLLIVVMFITGLTMQIWGANIGSDLWQTSIVLFAGWCLIIMIVGMINEKKENDNYLNDKKTFNEKLNELKKAKNQ